MLRARSRRAGERRRAGDDRRGDRATSRRRGSRSAPPPREPFHAYLLAGPARLRQGGRRRGRWPRSCSPTGAADPGDARRRALADPSPHPDLVWLRPPGTQHLVEDVRERVIAQVAYRPFEGERRVFVIEAAEAMAEESQNALLKTLEEPPAFAHLILVSAEPEALLETVRSRCRAVRFARLGPEAVEARLAEGADSDAERRAAARLCGGDVGDGGASCSTEEGRELRAAVEELARAVRSGELADAPWTALASAADAAGEREAARGARRAPPRRRRRRPSARGPGARKRSPRGRGGRRSAPRAWPATRPSTSASACSAPGCATSPRSPRAAPSWSSTPTAPPSSPSSPRGSTRAARAAPASW